MALEELGVTACRQYAEGAEQYFRQVIALVDRDSYSIEAVSDRSPGIYWADLLHLDGNQWRTVKLTYNEQDHVWEVRVIDSTNPTSDGSECHDAR